MFWAVTLCAFIPLTAHAAQQRLMATVTASAPIYIGPKVQPIPLRTAAVGTRLEVLAEEGDWVQVRFGDPVLGPRVGWVQAKLIRIERPELQPMDLSVPPERPPSAEPRATSPTRTADRVDGVGGFSRSGFLIGLSAGLGWLSCEDCGWDYGLGLSFHVGGMVGEKVGLMYDNAATVIVLDDDVVSLDTMTVAVQSFVGRRGWVKAGAGFGLISCTGCLSFPISEGGLALMGGAGGELVQRGRFALDLQGRFTLNFFEDIRFYTTMATVGFNWY